MGADVSQVAILLERHRLAVKAIIGLNELPVPCNETLNGLVDGLKLNFPEDFLEAKLVDGLVTKEELKGKLATLAGADAFKDVKMVSFGDYVSAKATPNVKAKKKIDLLEEELEAKEKELYDMKHELISAQMKMEDAQRRYNELKG